MSENADLEIDLSDDNRRQLLEFYIRDNMTSGSMEVYKRELLNGNTLHAAGYAMLNEAIAGCLINMVERAEQNEQQTD